MAELDEDYITKMEDVLETYERPYDPRQPVVCLDEKPVTLHAEVRRAVPAVPGREARRDNEYQRRKSLIDFYGADVGGEIWDRFTVHYTPTHGSWLNQAEIEIGIFSRQCLGTRRIPDLLALRQEAAAWNRGMNRAKIKINWKFDRKAARRKFGYTKNSFTRSRN